MASPESPSGGELTPIQERAIEALNGVLLSSALSDNPPLGYESAHRILLMHERGEAFFPGIDQEVINAIQEKKGRFGNNMPVFSTLRMLDDFLLGSDVYFRQNADKSELAPRKVIGFFEEMKPYVVLNSSSVLTYTPPGNAALLTLKEYEYYKNRPKHMHEGLTPVKLNLMVAALMSLITGEEYCDSATFDYLSRFSGLGSTSMILDSVLGNK